MQDVNIEIPHNDKQNENTSVFIKREIFFKLLTIMIYDEFKIIVTIMMELLFYIWSKRFIHLEHCQNLRKVLHKTRER